MIGENNEKQRGNKEGSMRYCVHVNTVTVTETKAGKVKTVYVTAEHTLLERGRQIWDRLRKAVSGKNWLSLAKLEMDLIRDVFIRAAMILETNTQVTIRYSIPF